VRQYKLDKKDYISKKQLHIERLELDNILSMEYFKFDILTLINYFNEEYKWDGMFDINEVENRIKNNHVLFILYYDKQPIGYVWFKEIDSKTTFGYNLYVTKKIGRPSDSAEWFYNEVSGIMLNEYDSIKVEIEDWNNVVFKLVENIGYKIC
jgi:hypothetical protein